MPVVSDVERVAAADLGAPPGHPDSFAIRFERPGKPVVIAGGARAWPAVRAWSPAALKARLGGVEIAFKLSATHKHPDFNQPTLAATFARGTSSFGELLDRVTTGPLDERARRLFTGDERWLLRRRDGVESVDPELAPLLGDVERPAFIPPERLYTVWAWFSGPGVRTWLHYDNNGCHNLNGQITGRKEALLIPPEALPAMALFEPGGGNPALNCSRIDAGAGDAEIAAKWPGYATAPALRATLEAGDLLFIPAWWFHTFAHLGDFNSNVNFWWKPEAPVTNAVAARQARIDEAAAAK